MEKEYFTVAELAERFKVSRQAVYDWIKDGRLKAIKIGNRTRIPLSAIESFIRPVEPGEPIETGDD
ncbi:MAG: DNA-binding protein [Chloroflexi bacterium]|nr:MAG: DNA-binding protein [Chloroflexota bacterium]